jgi:hypothetical protein
MELPFGLILKWLDRTWIEAIAMQMARAVGMLIPEVYVVGSTRIPLSANLDPHEAAWVAA